MAHSTSPNGKQVGYTFLRLPGHLTRQARHVSGQKKWEQALSDTFPGSRTAYIYKFFGFLNTKAIHKYMDSALEFIEDHRDEKIVLVGTSFGGLVAHLTAKRARQELRTDSVKGMLTHGYPYYLTNRFLNAYNLRHHRDDVFEHQVPYLSIGGYLDVLVPYWLAHHSTAAMTTNIPGTHFSVARGDLIRRPLMKMRQLLSHSKDSQLDSSIGL